MASSARSPSPKASLTRATTLSQFVIYSGAFSLLSSTASPVHPSTAAFPYVADTFAAVASSFRASANQLFECSASISEGLLERWFCSRFTTHYILSSVGTDYSTADGSTDTGIFYPGGSMRWYRSTCSTVIRSRVT